MPLFASSRDALLVKSLNREIIQRFISVEIAFFKLSLSDTEINLYGESGKKNFYQPIRLFSLINKEESLINDVDTGLDVSQNVIFSFLRDDLKDCDIVFEEGDIIKFDGKYYEIDNVRTTQYWAGRNPDTLLITTEGRSNMDFGYNIAVKAQTHLTRLSQLNLVDVRSGINTTKASSFIPKNL